MNTLQETLSTIFEERNQERGYSISELARRAGIKRVRVDRFLKKETTLRVGELSRLASALDTSFEELLSPELLSEDLGAMQVSLLQHLLNTEDLHEHDEDVQLYWYHKTYNAVEEAQPWGGPDLTDERLSELMHLLVLEGEKRLYFGLGENGTLQLISDDEHADDLLDACDGEVRSATVDPMLYGLLRYFAFDSPSVNLSLIGIFANGRRIENRQSPSAACEQLDALEHGEDPLFTIDDEYELVQRHQRLQHRVRKELDSQAANAKEYEQLLSFCTPEQLRNPHDIDPASIDFSHFRSTSMLQTVETDEETASGFGLKTTFVTRINEQPTAVSPAVALPMPAELMSDFFDDEIITFEDEDDIEEKLSETLDAPDIGDQHDKEIARLTDDFDDERIERAVHLRRYVLGDYPLRFYRTDFELPDSIDELPPHDDPTFTLVEQDWFEVERDYAVDTPVQQRKREKAGTVHIGKLKESYTDESEHQPPEQLYLTEKARSEHTWIKGSTGHGKSTLMNQMACQDIKDGLPVIYMDFTSDLTAPSTLADTLDRRDELKRLHYSSVSMGDDVQNCSMTYNPIAESFEVDEINDPRPVLDFLHKSVKAYLGESLYHRQEAEKLVERLVYAAAYSGHKANIEDLYLGVAQRRVRKEVFKMARDFLKHHGDKEQIDEFKGILESESTIKNTWDENDWKEKTHRVSSQLDSLIRGDLGSHLRAYVPEVSVREVVDNNSVWIVQAPVTQAPQHAIFLYNMVLQSLHRIATNLRRNAEHTPISVYINNFPYAMTGTLIQHLRQSGQAGLMFHVGTQDESARDLPGLDVNQEIMHFYDQFSNRLIFQTSDEDHVGKVKRMVSDNPDGGQRAGKQLPYLADDEAMAEVQLKSDYPDPGVRGRSFPAVGRYKLQLDKPTIDDDDIERLLTILGQRKKETLADRKVKREDVKTLSLADMVQSERDSLWEKR